MREGSEKRGGIKGACRTAESETGEGNESETLALAQRRQKPHIRDKEREREALLSAHANRKKKKINKGQARKTVHRYIVVSSNGNRSPSNSVEGPPS
jgi:hypothetical protein